MGGRTFLEPQVEVNLKEASPRPVLLWEGTDMGAEAGLGLHRFLSLNKKTDLALRLPHGVLSRSSFQAGPVPVPPCWGYAWHPFTD